MAIAGGIGRYANIAAELNIFKSFSMKPVFLTAAVRTPIGRFGGSLKDLTAAIWVAVAKESLRRANIQPVR